MEACRHIRNSRPVLPIAARVSNRVSSEYHYKSHAVYPGKQSIAVKGVHKTSKNNHVYQEGRGTLVINQSLSVSSGFGPPLINHCSFRWRLRSSTIFCWFLVSFFFFLGTGDDPFSPPSSAPLAAGVPWIDTLGVPSLDLTGVLLPLPLGLLASRKASSTIAALPLWVILPASTCHISGPKKVLIWPPHPEG